MAKPKFYESFFILRPDITEDEVSEITEKLTGIITSHEGAVLKSDKWAERTLAYEIQDTKKGIYHIIVYSSLPSAASEVEKALRSFQNDVLRFINVSIPELEARKTAGEKVDAEGGSDAKDRNKRNLIVRKRYGRIKFETITPEDINYKNVDLLSHFITERKKISPRRSTGLSSYGQRLLSNAIKTARVMALLPFTVLHD